MAKRRQTYNLDRQTKHFDIHKQFMGGLKTIDTDDSLGSVFLRDIDNLSLSEFGFLEKRYGTYVSDEFPGIEFQADKPIQGYFEYVDDDGDFHKILFYNGEAYIQNPKAINVSERNIFIKRTLYYTEPNLTYPVTNEIENDTGWTGNQVTPPVVEPTEPTEPPGTLELLAKSTSKAFMSFAGFEFINLKATSTGSKASIVFADVFNVSLSAKSSLNATFVSSDFVLLNKISANSTNKATITFAKVEDINLIAKANSSANITFAALEEINLIAKANSFSNILFISVEPISSLIGKSSTKALIDAEKLETSPPIEIVTATFNSAGGSPTYSSISEPAPLFVESPVSPTRTGYTFAGWSPSLPRNISANTTFTAQWTANTYTITFDKQSGTGGTSFATATFDSNMPSATAPTRNGFSFNGYWDAISGGTRYYNNNMSSARTWNKTSNTTLFARWTACLASGTTIGSPYCVGFDLYQTKANGSCGTYADLIEVNSSSCGYVGPTTATPSTGTDSVTSTSVTFTVANNDDNSVSITWNIREGSQFGSVVRNGTINNVGVGNLGLRNIVGSNLNSGTIHYLTDVIATASGKFASAAGTVRNLTTTTPPPAPTVTATFSSNGGSPTYNSQSGPSPLSVSNPGSPTRSGFTFLGWSPSVPTTITSNTFFTAQWQDNTPAPTVTATFNSAGGTPTYNSQSGSAPLYVTSPGSPTRSGFTFLGWSPSVNTDITSNTTFTAQWQDDTPTPTTYTVSAGITRNTQGSWYLLAPADWESVAGSVSGTTTITTMGLTTLTSSVPENGDFTIFVPSSVNYNGETYTFMSWVVNGVNQPQGENLYSISSVQGNLTLQAVYETFGLGGF